MICYVFPSLFFFSLLDPSIFCVGALLLPRCAVTVYMRFFLSILYYLPTFLSLPFLLYLFSFFIVWFCYVLVPIDL
jgi:hypothetical protein